MQEIPLLYVASANEDLDVAAVVEERELILDGLVGGAASAATATAASTGVRPVVALCTGERGGSVG